MTAITEELVDRTRDGLVDDTVILLEDLYRRQGLEHEVDKESAREFLATISEPGAAADPAEEIQSLSETRRKLIAFHEGLSMSPKTR